jgi:hypothetical protein
MRWVNEIPQVRSDREHALEDQELMDLRPQMRLQLRSLKRQALPVRTQPRPATTVTVRLMSLGVRPNTSEGVFPRRMEVKEKTGQMPLPQSGRLGRVSHSGNHWPSTRTLHEFRRWVAGPLDAPDYCTMFFPGCYNRSALASGYLVILSSV